MACRCYRSLIESFKPCAWVKLTEAADALALLVSLIYDRNMVDSLPTSDLEEALRLCDKYAVFAADCHDLLLGQTLACDLNVP